MNRHAGNCYGVFLGGISCNCPARALGRTLGRTDPLAYQDATSNGWLVRLVLRCLGYPAPSPTRQRDVAAEENVARSRLVIIVQR